MHCSKAWLILWAAAALGADFNGANALEYTRKAVEFGPRPPASAAIEKLRTFIEAELRKDRCETIPDAFNANGPGGPVPMRNIIAKFPGKSGRATVITGHYDTKLIPGQNFVGANDGGSSTGFLLELARILPSIRHADDIYVVFFDGEEAFGQWSETDSLYGSRHLAAKWTQDGTLPKIRALINVDMIGDKDLGILQEMNSTPKLRTLVWQAAAELGFGQYFLETGFATDDDHMPFLSRGVPSVDLIDFDYGRGNENWHTGTDTMDKLSAHSFEVVGKTVVKAIHKLEK
jgi:Zn-dependent M28 family amino/carboxypeptidase